MRSIILILTASFFILSCMESAPKKTTYSYENFTIERISYLAKTEFYLDKVNSENKEKIWTEYSGMNNGFSGYLVFKKNEVRVLSGDGYFEVGNNNLFKYIRIIATQRPSTNDENVCYISSNIEREKEINSKTSSKVSMVYQ